MWSILTVAASLVLVAWKRRLSLTNFVDMVDQISILECHASCTPLNHLMARHRVAAVGLTKEPIKFQIFVHSIVFQESRGDRRSEVIASRLFGL